MNQDQRMQSNPCVTLCLTLGESFVTFQQDLMEYLDIEDSIGCFSPANTCQTESGVGRLRFHFCKKELYIVPVFCTINQMRCRLKDFEENKCDDKLYPCNCCQNIQ